MEQLVGNKVYILTSQGNWDGTFTEVEVFSTKEKATEAYLEAVADIKETLEENYDDGELEFDEEVENLHFETFLKGWYDDYHQIISVNEYSIK